MELSFFNINDGFPEAIIRGFRSGFLTTDDYRRLGAAESLEDMRTALDDTDYGQFMQDEPSPLEVPMVVRCAKAKLAHEFRFLRAQAVPPMDKFLDFIAAEKMINNVVMLLQGTLNNKPPKELLSSFELDPLGWFEEMKTIPTLDPSGGYRDLYQTILIDTPVGPYFESFLQSIQSEDGNVDVAQVLSETDLDIMKNILRKAWLEDFYAFCVGLGGTTAQVMGHILKMEADFAVLSVTLNALNTPLGSAQQLADRNALYPNFGYLFPEGAEKVRKAFNETTVRAALEPYANYLKLYDACKEFYESDSKKVSRSGVGKMKSIEDLLYVENVSMYELAFEEQYHYGVAYAWVKLREQEIRNMEWMSNMIIMDRRDRMDDVVPIFKPRV
jgi:V-type H+-transporting ATPase subunit d